MKCNEAKSRCAWGGRNKHFSEHCLQLVWLHCKKWLIVHHQYHPSRWCADPNHGRPMLLLWTIRKVKYRTHMPIGESERKYETQKLKRGERNGDGMLSTVQHGSAGIWATEKDDMEYLCADRRTACRKMAKNMDYVLNELKLRNPERNSHLMILKRACPK